MMNFVENRKIRDSPSHMLAFTSIIKRSVTIFIFDFTNLKNLDTMVILWLNDAINIIHQIILSWLDYAGIYVNQYF